MEEYTARFDAMVHSAHNMLDGKRIGSQFLLEYNFNKWIKLYGDGFDKIHFRVEDGEMLLVGEKTIDNTRIDTKIAFINIEKYITFDYAEYLVDQSKPKDSILRRSLSLLPNRSSEKRKSSQQLILSKSLQINKSRRTSIDIKL